MKDGEGEKKEKKEGGRPQIQKEKKESSEGKNRGGVKKKEGRRGGEQEGCSLTDESLRRNTQLSPYLIPHAETRASTSAGDARPASTASSGPPPVTPLDEALTRGETVKRSMIDVGRVLLVLSMALFIFIILFVLFSLFL